MTYYNLLTAYYLFYFQFNSLPPSGTSRICSFQDGASTYKCALHINAQSSFEFYDIGGTLLSTFGGPSGPGIGGVWHAIQAVIGTGLAAPAAPTLSTATTGGTMAAGTYGVKVTYTSVNGESVASSSTAQVTTGTTSTITVTSPSAATGATNYKVYMTAAGGSTYYLQTLGGGGLGIALGTNYTQTAPPSTNTASPPSFSGSNFAISVDGTLWATSGASGANLGTSNNGSIRFGGIVPYTDTLIFDDIYIDNAALPALVPGNLFFPGLYSNHEMPWPGFMGNRQQYWRCFPSDSRTLVPSLDITQPDEFSWSAQTDANEVAFARRHQQRAVLLAERAQSQQLQTTLDIFVPTQLSSQAPDASVALSKARLPLQSRAKPETGQVLIALDLSVPPQNVWLADPVPIRLKRISEGHDARHLAPGPFIDQAVVAAPLIPTPGASSLAGTIPPGTYYVKVTYTNDVGETNQPQAAVPITTSQTGDLNFSSPAPSWGATGYNVYVGTSAGGPFYFQAGASIGVSITLLSLTLSGKTIPTTNSAFVAGSWMVPPVSWLPSERSQLIPHMRQTPADRIYSVLAAMYQDLVGIAQQQPLSPHIKPLELRQSEWIDPHTSVAGPATAWQIGLQDQTLIRRPRPIDSSQTPLSLIPATTMLPFLDLVVTGAVLPRPTNLLNTTAPRTPSSLDGVVVINTGNPLFVTILPMTQPSPAALASRPRPSIGELPIPTDKQPIDQMGWNVPAQVPSRRKLALEGGQAHVVGTTDFVIGWHTANQERLLTGAPRRSGPEQSHLATQAPSDPGCLRVWDIPAQIPQFRRALWLSDAIMPPTMAGTSVIIVGPPFFVPAAAIYFAGAWQADIRES